MPIADRVLTAFIFLGLFIIMGIMGITTASRDREIKDLRSRVEVLEQKLEDTDMSDLDDMKIPINFRRI